VLVLALGMLVSLSAVAGVVRGVAVTARHRAEMAADLAALAGATAVVDGYTSACGAADRVARSNGARLSRCVVAGDVVEVLVVRAVPFGRLGSWPASGRARAGPGAAAG